MYSLPSVLQTATELLAWTTSVFSNHECVINCSYPWFLKAFQNQRVQDWIAHMQPELARACLRAAVPNKHSFLLKPHTFFKNFFLNRHKHEPHSSPLFLPDRIKPRALDAQGHIVAVLGAFHTDQRANHCLYYTQKNQLIFRVQATANVKFVNPSQNGISRLLFSHRTKSVTTCAEIK